MRDSSRGFGDHVWLVIVFPLLCAGRSPAQLVQVQVRTPAFVLAGGFVDFAISVAVCGYSLFWCSDWLATPSGTEIRQKHACTRQRHRFCEF